MHDSIPSQLSDDNLVAAIKHLCGVERGATASMVAHLAELDARRLYLGAGFPSLFAYCCEVLGLSEHETYNRIEVARAGRKFPALLATLADGSLNLTTARMLARHLTSENEEELLAAAAYRRKAEVEEWLAGRLPRPDVATSIRKLPASRPVMVEAPGAGSARAATAQLVPTEPVPAGSPAVADSTESAVVITAGTASRRPLVRPLAPQRYEIRFTARAETREKLRQAQDLLRHAVPSGDPAEIFDRALSALLDQLAKEEAGGDGAANGGRPRHPGGLAPRSGRGEAGGLAARRRPVCLRGDERPAVRRARLSGVASRPALRGRRRGHWREPRAALPHAQRL
jgi:hypothetical protein